MCQLPHTMQCTDYSSEEVLFGRICEKYVLWYYKIKLSLSLYRQVLCMYPTLCFSNLFLDMGRLPPILEPILCILQLFYCSLFYSFTNLIMNILDETIRARNVFRVIVFRMIGHKGFLGLPSLSHVTASSYLKSDVQIVWLLSDVYQLVKSDLMTLKNNLNNTEIRQLKAKCCLKISTHTLRATKSIHDSL